jgi:hypothetical protein
MTPYSFDDLNEQDTIFMELSVDPRAKIFELGWNDNVIIGELHSFSLVDAVQQFYTVLKKPIAKVLEEAPNANFLQLGAHFAQRIDSLTSILTNIFSQCLSTF